MKKIFALMSICIITSGCSMISANYISSSGIQRQSVNPNRIQVFYEVNEVPFKYKEIGRIFLKNINYWADRDPAGQIDSIKNEAAKSGADAVIIIKEMRREASFGIFDGAGGGNSGDIFQYSGIAIIRE